MNVAVMQPYLFPYIGYLQLIKAVDTFVIYDDVNFIKKGWINRNRILSSDGISTFSLPVSKISQNKKINEHCFHEPKVNQQKLFNKLSLIYNDAPYKAQLTSILDRSFQKMNNSPFNIVDVLQASLDELAQVFDLQTRYILASSLEIEESVKGQDRILEICRQLNATTYINPQGAKDIGLYDKKTFENAHIELKFIQPHLAEYTQFNQDVFVPGLSVIDLIANVAPDELPNYANGYLLD